MKNERDGMGLLKMRDGTLYVGDFYKGRISGIGMLLVPDGNYVSYCDSCTVYIGNYHNGKKSGIGTCYARNGDVVYSGKFIEDKPIESYPSTDDYSFRYFSLIKDDGQNMFVGEIYDGQLNGFGLIIGKNGDLYMGNFKNGLKNGIGLYLKYDAEWEILNYKENNYSVISSSGKYRSAEAELKQGKKQIRGIMLENLSAVVTSATQLVSSIQNNKPENNSVELSNSGNINTSYNNISSTKSPADSRNPASAGTALSTDRNIYSKYETQLIQMRTYPERYPNYASEYKNISSKMQQIRAKWQSRGYTITKSPYEGNLQ